MMISSASPFIMWSASDAHLFYLGADGVLPVSCEDCSITLSDVELLVDVELDDNVLDGWTGYKVRMSQCWDSSLYVLWDAISCYKVALVTHSHCESDDSLSQFVRGV